MSPSLCVFLISDQGEVFYYVANCKSVGFLYGTLQFTFFLGKGGGRGREVVSINVRITSALLMCHSGKCCVCIHGFSDRRGLMYST